MINDLELIQDPTLLYKKKCIIWGAGENGKRIYQNLIKLGISMEQIFICDSKPDQYVSCSYKVFSIEQIVRVIGTEPDNYMIIISVESLDVQDEIIEQLRSLGLFDRDIYTLYGIKWASLFESRKKGYVDLKRDWDIVQHGMSSVWENDAMTNLSFFLITPYLEQTVLVYQPGKVGSKSVCKSLERYGVHSLHVHQLKSIPYIGKYMESIGGKIISAIRNPLDWNVSQFWQLFEYMYIDHPVDNFNKLHEFHWNNQWIYQELNWFEREMKGVLGIDVFDFPFDKEKGFTIIKKGNIELLLMTTEKLSGLSGVIGEFMGISNFKLTDVNVGQQKDYRFAYEEYKKKIRIPNSIYEEFVNAGNRYLWHFYTDEDMKSFYQKWHDNLIDDELLVGKDIKIMIE